MLQSSQVHHFNTWSSPIQQCETDDRPYPSNEESDECCNQVRNIISILGHILLSRVRLMTDLILLMKNLMNAAIKSGTSFLYLVIYY